MSARALAVARVKRGRAAARETQVWLYLLTSLASLAHLPGHARAQSLDWYPQQKLLAAGGKTGDQFGYGIAHTDGIALISALSGEFGAPDALGAVHVFAEVGTRWEERAVLRAPDAAPFDQFGVGTALMGDLLVVGSTNVTRGSLYVFASTPSGWEQRQKIVEPVQGWIGHVLASSGDTLVAGAPWLMLGPEEDQGVVLVYERDADQLREVQRLTATDVASYSSFGFALAIDGDTLAVGAPRRVDTPAEVDIFQRSANGWTLRQRLEPPRGDVSDDFGSALALAGDVLVVGAPGATVGANPEQGAVYVFVHEGASWTLQQRLSAADGAASDGFGAVLTATPTLIAVGVTRATFEDPTPGRVYMFELRDRRWTQRAPLVAPDGTVRDAFGAALALAPTQLLIGAYAAEHEGSEGRGAVYALRLLATPASACADDAECGSAHCIDGMCCDGACGPCGDCSTGTCSPRHAGSAGVPSCAPYLCSGEGALCPGACATHVACSAASFCQHGVCVRRWPDGAACTDGAECLGGQCGADGRCLGGRALGAACQRDDSCGSGFCSDGVCCELACSGQCEACDTPDAPGTCVAVRGAPGPGRAPCAGDAEPCAGVCDGRERSACVYASADTPCGGACRDGEQTQSSCDGLGACVAGELRSCDNLTCADAFVCKARCATRSDCVAGFTCSADGSCSPSAVCLDQDTSQGAFGVVRQCAPFRCASTGSCLDRCRSVADCSPPNVCDRRGRCVPQAAPAQRGCAVGPGRQAGGGLSLLCLLLYALRRGSARRARRRAAVLACAQRQ